MPYVVTAKRPCPACAHGPNAGGEHRPESVSRRAVATLEEARQVAYDAMHDDQTCIGHARAEITLAIGRMPESGGTVGPLPDGTVIEVESVSWNALVRAVDHPDLLAVVLHLGDHIAHWPHVQRQVLAAFNAREAS